jgi:predicted RNase H-like HicB family nuclease
MKLTAVFERGKDGEYTCTISEFPAVIPVGESLENAKAKVIEALKTALDCPAEAADDDSPVNATRDQQWINEALASGPATSLTGEDLQGVRQKVLGRK